MQTWPKNIGTVALSFGTLTVAGNANELYAWSHRSGAVWPCSMLDDCDRVCATLDKGNGDLTDLDVIPADACDIPADELTAWIDDCLTDTPFAHLARNPA